MLHQRSEEWYAARIGKVTASRAKDLLSTGRRKTADCKCGNQRAKPPKCSRCGDPVVLEPGDSYKSYRRELLMGRKYGIHPPELTNIAAIEHGIALEPEAISAYEFYSGHDVIRQFFVLHPKNDNIGCSPDGFVTESGLIEIKCPYPVNHMKHLEGDINDHRPQIDFQLGVTKREWCDFVSYSDDIRFGEDQLFVTRIYAANRQEEIAHLMSMAKRLDREITDALSRTETPESVANVSPGGQATAVGDHDGGADGSDADRDIPF